MSRIKVIRTMDEFLAHYLPKYKEKYPITMRVSKLEQKHILYQRGGFTFKPRED